MSAVSDKKLFTVIKKLDEIAPFWWSTWADRELDSSIFFRKWILYTDSISFTIGKGVIVPIFHDYAWLVIDLSETSSHEPDDPVFEIASIIE